MKPLTFSSETLSIYSATLTHSLTLSRPSIVINLSDTPVYVDEDKSTFLRLESRLLRDVSISGQGASVLIIQTNNDDFLAMPGSTKQHIEHNWSYANPLEVDTDQKAKLAVHKSNVLKTKKDVVDGYQLFFCFLPGGEQGRIHRYHDLYEVHTQILGMGKMEKYKTEAHESYFETSHMCPGYTHYPYYDADRNYPWHGYIATTDSVWLAIVRYN